MAKAYDYVVVGTGRTEAEALKTAEEKLPESISDTTFYARLRTGAAQQIGPKTYKVEIGYDVRGESPTTQAEGKRVRGEPSSFGSADLSARTRPSVRLPSDLTGKL